MYVCMYVINYISKIPCKEKRPFYPKVVFNSHKVAEVGILVFHTLGWISTKIDDVLEGCFVT